ncbi:hypothetical protein TNCV_215021 [Trichonephila clavipes]|nr:hypothetical protein TNCV_215021 [Trichonephila clavipes]
MSDTSERMDISPSRLAQVAACEKLRDAVSQLFTRDVPQKLFQGNGSFKHAGHDQEKGGIEQDVEHPLSTERQVTTEVVTPKKTLPHPIMLKVKDNLREQINCISEKFPKIRNRLANDVVKMFTNDPEEYREPLSTF